MAGILSAIGDFFTLIYTIIKLVLNLLITLFWLVFKALEVLTRVAGAFPILTAGVLVIVIVCVVYKILGREASS